MRVGVLALQGNYDKHAQALQSYGVSPLLVKKINELEAVSALVLPGGESTAMLRLMSEEFYDKLASRLSDGMPVLATCAGTILLANEVLSPKQKSLAVLDVTVIRNAYGSQIDSCVVDNLAWSESGYEILKAKGIAANTSTLEAVLIRAPKISRVGKRVKVLLEYNSSPLMVMQDNIIACTFHPEMSTTSTDIYKLFFSLLGTPTLVGSVYAN